MDILTALMLSGLGFTLAAPLGPVNAEMIKQTLANKNGWKLGTITGIGAMSADFFIAMGVLFLGAKLFIEYLDILWVKLILIVANVFILGYIGLSSLKQEIEIVDTEIGTENELNALKQYRWGFLLVTTSPWSYGWWASFGPVMIESGVPLETFSDRLLATIFFILGIFTWIVIFNGGLKISHSFASPRLLRIITRGSALILIILAVKIALDGICIAFGVCLFNI